LIQPDTKPSESKKRNFVPDIDISKLGIFTIPAKFNYFSNRLYLVKMKMTFTK
jgi:hypothetical protein